jgi:abortive infection bacteriophage resistance protein
MAAYNKPRLSYEAQVQLMIDRGLACSDPLSAAQLLKQVGYYRLSAYVYPFRELLPPDQARQSSPAHYRSDVIRTGTSFEQVEALWKFDRKLRLKFLDALEVLEIGLRSRLGYVLSERDVFGHLDTKFLDAATCAEPCRDGAMDLFTDWLERYEKLKDAAKNEDYMVHHRVKYGDPVPVWIAVEFLDFGALCRLYRLLEKSDQNAIAAHMGVKGGALLRKWLTSLNYLRNVCAHHSRLWNRVVTYQAAQFNPSQVEAELQHAARSLPRDKLYVLAASLAYLVRHIDPSTTWHLDFRTHVRKFPDVPDKSPEADMGFPVGWDALPLWNAVPSK